VWPLRLGEEKKEEEEEEDRKKLQGKNIMAPLLHRVTMISAETSFSALLFLFLPFPSFPLPSSP